MAYLRKEYKELMKRIDKELKLPKGWHYFVKKQLEKQNVILKNKNNYICSNCKNEFKSKKKINEYEKCPKCKRNFVVKNKRKTGHLLENRLVLLDKFDNNFIIRIFNIFSRINSGDVYHSKSVEYARIIFREDEILEFANNRLLHTMRGVQYVNHNNDGKTWRRYNYYYRSIDVEGKVFDKNLKELLQDTEYKYSQIWTLAKMVDEMDLKYALKNNLPSTEILVKMKLYKLALCPKTFNINGSFEDRFGVNKSYYKFMRDNNIDIDELHILKRYKKENIDAIRYLNKFNLRDIDKINKYMSLDKFVEYTKLKKTFDLRMYKDYLEFAEELKIDLKNKKYLFPKNLKEKHDELAKQIKIAKNKKITQSIKKRYKKLQKNSYHNNTYMIFPAKSVEELEDESKQQNHCVRTYAERYAEGKCDIYFMRKKQTPEKSLVTIEVIENKIVQSRTKNNEDPNKFQKNFLDKWENEVLKVA